MNLTKKYVISFIMMFLIFDFVPEEYARCKDKDLEFKFLPSPIPTRYSELAKRTFDKGLMYFIWLESDDKIKGKTSETIEIPFRFAANPKVSNTPFTVVNDIEVIDKNEKKYRLKGTSAGISPSKDKKEKSLIVASYFLWALEFQGIAPKGESIATIYLRNSDGIRASNKLMPAVLLE